MNTKMILPEKICRLIADESFRTDETGMSESSVYIFKEKKVGSSFNHNNCGRFISYDGMDFAYIYSIIFH